MIQAKNNIVRISGNPEIILTETTFILKAVYSNMIDTYGEELANTLLVDIGKFAVADDDELDTITKEMMKELDEVLDK